MIKNKKVLFFGGVFSQWFKSPMEIDGITYNCCEQYMMYRKAIMFGDEDRSLQIIRSKDPKYQKKVGRQVEGFDINIWNSVCKDIVFRANMTKFTQNLTLQDELLKYDYDNIFVEASPYDKVWGIGLDANNPKAWDEETWEGTNWLGEQITKVRDSLITTLS